MRSGSLRLETCLACCTPRGPARGSRTPCPPCPFACRLPSTLGFSRSPPPSVCAWPAVCLPPSTVYEGCPPPPCLVPLGRLVLCTPPSLFGLFPLLPVLGWPASAVSAGHFALCTWVTKLGLTRLFCGLQFPSGVPLPLCNGGFGLALCWFVLFIINFI